MIYSKARFFVERTDAHCYRIEFFSENCLGFVRCVRKTLNSFLRFTSSYWKRDDTTKRERERERERRERDYTRYQMSAPPPPPSSPSSSSTSNNNNDNVENAIAFLNHPSVKNVSSSKEKKQFLRNKHLTDAEISEAFERVGLVFDEADDDDDEKGASSGNASSSRSFLTTTTPTTRSPPPPAVPHGVIQKHANYYYGGGGLRWTQVVAYACALGMFGSYAYPKLKRCVIEYYSSSTRRREEEEAKKQAQLMRAISQSVTENLAEFEKKLKTRQETTESAVLQSVQNVEERLREELRMVKMTHAEDAIDERERSKEDMREVKKSLMEAVEEERKEAKKEMEALRRSVLKEMELAREKTNNNIKAGRREEKEEGESPSRRLGEKGYVAERVEAVENNKNNEDLDLDDYFQAKKRHQMELLGGEDDDDDYDNNNNNINNGSRGSSNLQQQQQQQQQQRAANVRKNMGTNQNQPQQRRVLEEPPRPKNFLEVIELVEKGEPVPGIKDIDDRPPNPDVALPPVSEDFEERTRKPWSMKPSDDASFEGHRPWDKYGNGAAASGEYSFDGGSGGWTPPSVPQMSDSARQAYGL